ncbi:ATP-binding protein [Streptomyces sp. NPDC002287]
MTDLVRRHCECAGSGAAGRAREEVARLIEEAARLGQAVPAAVQDAALLVVSELVTNAVRYAPGPCALDVGWSAGGLDILVTDSGPDLPQKRQGDPTGAYGGYGWPLVQCLSSRVEVRPTETGGKTVHAHLSPSSSR